MEAFFDWVPRRSLTQAYLSQNSAEVVTWGHLEAVLGIFQKLLSSRSNEAYAFQLLGTIVMNVSFFCLFLALFFLLLVFFGGAVWCCR